MSDPLIDPRLAAYGSERQREYLAAVNEHGGFRQAARAMGTGPDAVRKSLRNLMRLASTKGYEVDERRPRIVVADPFVVKGKSTYYDAEGVPKQEWVKTRLDGDRLREAMTAAVEAMAEDLPRLDAIERPTATATALCNQYTFTDAHMGMLAWHREGGADWDLKIAEGVLTRCFEQMMASAPPARVAVIAQLGDFLHSDGLLPVTPTSGHVLDQDGRFSKIVAAAVRVPRRIIDLALMRHDEVHFINAEGNHDLASSVWLRRMFAALYEREPRLQVNDSELPYYVYQHGKVMLAFHHGHLKKIDQLVGTFSAQYAPMWGETIKRYAHTGHFHQAEEREHMGMLVIRHPTLAARDAYAARNGYFSERQASVLTYHAEFGLVARNVVTPEMLAA